MANLSKAARRLRWTGVSFAGLLAAGSGPMAWAQAEVQEASQAATTQDAQDRSPEAEEITVTGRRAALEAADERKRRSETIVDSVVADDAGKLPDNSITEVLQRVPGVSIVRFAALNDPDHFSVQGSGVQVRGLTGVASRLNGRDIFSANNGRALLWGDVTPELMSAVDVYKASTADLIEGGTGGQIDLRTKLPFDFRDQDWHVAATGELSMGDLAQNADLSGSILISKNWSTGIGDIGFTGDVAYSRFTSVSQFFRLEPFYRTRVGASDYFIPGGFAYGDERFQRDRTGIYAAVQWSPSPDLTFTGTFFQSRYKNNSDDYASFVTSQSVAVDPASSSFNDVGGLESSNGIYVRDSATFLPSGAAITSGGNKGVLRSNTVTRDYSLAFKWAPQDGPLNVTGSIQRVDSNSIVDRLDVFRTVPYPTSFGLDLSGSLPQVSIADAGYAALSDPSQYLWQASMPHNEDNKGRLETAQLDLEYRFEDGFFRSFKVGGRFAKRTERDFSNGYNWAALGAGWNGDPQLTFADAAPGDVERHTFQDFFRGGVGLPTSLLFPSYDLVSQMDRTDLHTRYGGLAGIRQPGFILPNDRTDYRTETLAGYALARFGSAEGLSGNVGVRVVRIENESSGYYQQNPTQFVRNGQTLTLDGTVSGVRSGDASFTRFLPSVNFEYAPMRDTKVRFGYNVTLDNASFNALRASSSLGVATVTNQADPSGPGIFTNFTIDTGNPTLKPVLAHNFDLSFEYYGSGGTNFHIAPFYKRIENSFIYSVVQRQANVVFTNGTQEVATISANDFSNADEAAEIKGVEVGGRVFLDMLPGMLSGIGLEANYTFIDSKNPGDIYRDIDGVVHNDAPLVGLSKHNVNATFLYEKDPISFRVAYSWRSRYLMSTNSNGTNGTYPYYSAPGVSNTVQMSLPIYSSSYGSLDAGVRFKVTENFSFNVQGTNLTNSTQKTLQGGYPGGSLFQRAFFQSDRRIVAGISLAF